jgi:hypothetical protein
MCRLTLVFVALVLVAAPAHAAERKFDPAATAKAVAPYLDERTVAVVHVDLTRIDADALADQFATLTKIKLEDFADEKKTAADMLKSLTKAGAKDAFLIVTAADLPAEYPMVVIPLEKGANSKAILALFPQKKEGLHSYGPIPQVQAEQVGDAVIIGGDETRKRLKALKAVERPEVAKAFAAGGDGVARAAVFATTDTRKIFEETLPDLPPELGGGSIKVLTRGLQWIAIWIDGPPKLKLHAIVQASDKDAAKALHELTIKAMKFIGEQKEFRTDVPNADKLLAAFTPKLDGDRLTLTVDEATLTTFVGPVVEKSRALAARNAATNKLHELAMTMHSYERTHRRFPAVASFDKQGKPLLSWRVHLLPYLGEEKLYKEFKLDEPWDSEHNKKLIARMPAVYASPTNRKLGADGKTTYLAPVHTSAFFTGDKQGVTAGDVTDGFSVTVMLVDVDDDAAVIWTKPDDLKLDPKEPYKKLSARYGDNYLFAFADGSVQLLTKKIDNKTLWAIFTRNGGETVMLP